jgi:Ulp1 family protease
LCRYSAGAQPRVHFFNTFFINKLCRGDGG